MPLSISLLNVACNATTTNDLEFFFLTGKVLLYLVYLPNENSEVLRGCAFLYFSKSSCFKSPLRSGFSCMIFVI